MTSDSRKLKEEKLRRLYRNDPELYARQVLGVQWWAKQAEVARSVVENRKTLVRACHSIGKTHLGGGLVNWYFDCYDPSITLTTATTAAQVEDLLWKEVRVQRGARPGLMPKAPRMETTDDHFAVGYTARDATSFHGRHEERLLIIFDEATGIEAPFWEAGEGMMTGEDCRWVAFLNPTDTASRAHEEELGGEWNVIPVSVLDHPNIAADLDGRPAPFPKAVRLMWLQERVRKWCTPIAASDRRAGDIEFPPGSGEWYRPGPLFEGRVLGRWPTAGATSVWSEALWEAALVRRPIPEEPLEIGIDVARFGDDFTSFVARRGRAVLHHETHNGWDTSQTTGRGKQLCRDFCQEGEDPRRVLVKVDDDGVGGGVYDQREGFRFVRMNAGGKPFEPEEYPNRRSEYWFAVADRAQPQGAGIDVSRLSDESKQLLKRQAMAPKWKVDAQGRRVVEPKEVTKQRIGRSPDDMDAFNLAFAPPPPPEEPTYKPTVARVSGWGRGGAAVIRGRQ